MWQDSLSDAEESSFGNLGKRENGEESERSFDAAAFAGNR